MPLTGNILLTPGDLKGLGLAAFQAVNGCSWGLLEVGRGLTIPFGWWVRRRGPLVQLVAMTYREPFCSMTGAVEIPAYIFMCLGMDSIGRRKVLVFSLLSGALLCGVIMVIPKVSYFLFSLGHG